MTLAPLIDMINHTSTTFENADVARHEDALEIRASRNIDPGDEISFSYHSASSRFWVCEYGFWLEGNEFDDLDISGEVEGIVRGKRKVLERLGYWGLSSSVFY